MSAIDLTPEFFGMYFSYDRDGRYPVDGAVRPDVSEVYLQQGPIDGTDRLYRVALHMGMRRGDNYERWAAEAYISNAVVVGKLLDELSELSVYSDGLDCIAYYNGVLNRDVVLQWMRAKSQAPILPSLMYRANPGEYTALPGRRFHGVFFEFHDAIAVPGVNWSALRGRVTVPLHPYKENGTLLLRLKLDAHGEDRSILDSDWIELIHEHESESLTIVLKPVVDEEKRIPLHGRVPFGIYSDIAIAVGSESYAIVNGVVTEFAKPPMMKRERYIFRGDTEYTYSMVTRRIPSLVNDYRASFFEPEKEYPHMFVDLPGIVRRRSYSKDYAAKVTGISRSYFDRDFYDNGIYPGSDYCYNDINGFGRQYNIPARGLCREFDSDGTCHNCDRWSVWRTASPVGTRRVQIGPRDEELHLGVTMLPALQWRIYEIDVSDIDNPRLIGKYDV